MKIESQYCTILQGKALLKLGITEKAISSHVVYCPDPLGNEWYYHIIDDNNVLESVTEFIAPAFSLAEINIMLPESIYKETEGEWYYYMMFKNHLVYRSNEDNDWFSVQWKSSSHDGHEFDNEVEACADMLIKLLSSNCVYAKDCNMNLISK